jgi:hypothetical protein
MQCEVLLTTNDKSQVSLGRFIQVTHPLQVYWFVGTIQYSIEGPEVVSPIGSSVINIKTVQLSLAHLKGCDKIADEHIVFLRPYTETVHALKHGLNGHQAKQDMGIQHQVHGDLQHQEQGTHSKTISRHEPKQTE